MSCAVRGCEGAIAIRREVLQLMPALTVVGDAKSVQSEVTQTADILRPDKTVRSETAAKAKSILDKMASSMPSAQDPTNIVALPTPASNPAAVSTTGGAIAGFLL
jgi:hypothetical protein